MGGSDGTPHFLPACLIGGFGVPDRGVHSGSRRAARVSVRYWNKPDEIQRNQRADRILKARDEYRFDNPPPGVAPNIIDTFWKYEDQLPDAIDALERGAFSRDDWCTVLDHIHAQAVRNPDYRPKATKYLAELGHPAPTKDDLQVERLKTLSNTSKILADCRFALVRRPVDGHRFIINDKGYAKGMLDVLVNATNLVWPLNPEIAVLMVLDAAQNGDDYKAGPMRDLTLTPAMVDLVNEASWQLGNIKCILGHPDDDEYLLGQDADGSFSLPWLGPFRGTTDIGLSDWAVMNRAPTSRRIIVPAPRRP